MKEVARGLRALASFYKRNDKIFYKEILNDTIWQVDENSIEPKYLTNLGENEFSFDYKTLSGMSFLETFFKIFHL